MSPRSASRRAGLTRMEAVLLFVGFSGAWCCVSSGLLSDLIVRSAYHRPSQVKCTNELRQLALAAIQYADDHGAFPQVGARLSRQLAGGVDTNATTKVVRALVWTGYHDNPEGFVCPSSYDLFIPITDGATKNDLRRWFWAGQSTGDPARSPLVDDLPDPVLDRTDELSYGWVRRSVPKVARSTIPLVADRGQADQALRESGSFDAPAGLYGNHDGGANVARVDGSVEWVAGGEDAASLAAVDDPARDGFLAIRAPTRPGAPVDHVTPAVRTALTWAAVLVPPFAVLALLVWRVQRTAEAAGPIVVTVPRDAVVPVRPSRVEVLGPEERLKFGLGGAATGAGPVVLQHQQRCPACHDVVRGDEALSRCQACRAVFHADCVVPGGECPTLGCRAG